MFDVIIAASGESTRFGAEKNKLLCSLNEYTVLENSVRPFLNIDGLQYIIIATSDCLFDDVTAIAKRLDNRIVVCRGGDTRTKTVKNALKLVSADYVLIHDGARPFVTENTILAVLNGAQVSGAGVPVIPVTDTIADISKSYKTLCRDNLRAVQTPQGFKTELIKQAYDSTVEAFTDDIAVYMTKFTNLLIVKGDENNRKITVFSDLSVPSCRVGVGFDTHLLVSDRKLILGGVLIPHDKGLLGHSDADVLTHAVMDALLSAAGLRDIGYYFPDSDPQFKDADSIALLFKVLSLLSDKGFKVHNISATILAEKPKLSPYIPKIIENLSGTCGVYPSNFAILATTTEKSGLIGSEGAISCIATATIVNKSL